MKNGATLKPIANPSNTYGYEEAYAVADFFDALKFNHDANMPLLIRAGIFFGVFNKNTIYPVHDAGEA